MNSIRSIQFIAIFCLALTMPNHLFAAKITLMTHNLQGQTYADKDGVLRGKKLGGKRAFNLELVHAIVARIGHCCKISEVPFARGLTILRQENNQALFNVSRTSARENDFKWVGPLQKEVDYFYERSSNKPITSLKQAKHVDSICVLRGSIHYTLLKEQGFTNLIENPTYVGCFKMLAKGRVQLTASAASTVCQKIDKAGIPYGLIRQTPVVVLQSGGYIAFSRNVPDEIIHQWQNALDTLKRSGKYDTLRATFHPPAPPLK